MKLPPLAIVLIFAAGMLLASRSGSSLALNWPWRGTLAVIFLIGGIAIALAAVMKFHQAKTTVNPMKPEETSAMVTSGVYRLSRNPMYLGFLLALLAWAIWLAHVLAFALLPFFVIYMNRFQIIPEERALAAKFGGKFTEYRNSVRRWL